MPQPEKNKLRQNRAIKPGGNTTVARAKACARTRVPRLISVLSMLPRDIRSDDHKFCAWLKASKVLLENSPIFLGIVSSSRIA